MQNVGRTQVTTLHATFPELVAEISSRLADESSREIVKDLHEAVITQVTYDNSADASYICVESKRELNVVERNVIGRKHGETIQVEAPYWIALDIDNFGRLTGIELLSPPSSLKTMLRKRAV